MHTLTTFASLLSGALLTSAQSFVTRAIEPTASGEIGINPVSVIPKPASQYVAVTGTSTHWIGVDNVDPTSTVEATIGSSTTSLDAPFAIATSDGGISVIPTDLKALQPLLDTIKATCGAAAKRQVKRQDEAAGLAEDDFACVRDYIDALPADSASSGQVAWLRSMLPGSVAVSFGTAQTAGTVAQFAAVTWVLTQLGNYISSNPDETVPPSVEIPTDNYVEASEDSQEPGSGGAASTGPSATGYWVTEIEHLPAPTYDSALAAAVQSVYDGEYYTMFPACSLVDDTYCSCSQGQYSGTFATTDGGDDPCSFSMLPTSTLDTASTTSTSETSSSSAPTATATEAVTRYMGFLQGVVKSGDKSSSTVVAVGGKDIDVTSADVLCGKTLYIPDEENGGQEVFYSDAGTEVPPNWDHPGWDYDGTWTNCDANAVDGELTVTCDGMDDVSWSCTAAGTDDEPWEGVTSCTEDERTSTWLIYRCETVEG